MNNKKKKLERTLLSGLLLLGSMTGFAEDSNSHNDMQNLTEYLQNLGEYMGYDLTNFCPQTGGPCNAPPSGSTAANFSSLLINSAAASGNQLNLMTSVIGALLPAIPSGSGEGQQQSSFQVIPSTNTTLAGYSNLFSKVGNQAFSQYNSPSAGTVSVSSIVDQVPFQTDPVSQTLLDIISTPDSSFCVNPGKGFFNPCYTGDSNSSKNGGGPVLSKTQVMMNVIGDPPPGTGYFALPTTNAQIISQLSSDSLLGPLLFSNSNQNSGSAVNSSAGSNTGLPASNQAQQAANFIRYASGMVTPLSTPNRTDYDKLYASATNASGNVSLDDQAQAKSTLANYLTSVRVYAAQSSIGISNLYYMLSKRMPQNAGSGSSGQTSQALSEFIMATWRLYTPTNPSSNSQNTQQWVAQINQASSATVQKEIAILLAEINYQLYLTRQQQERLLLTQSMLLLQNAKSAQPNPNITSAAANGSTSSEE